MAFWFTRSCAGWLAGDFRRAAQQQCSPQRCATNSTTNSQFVVVVVVFCNKIRCGPADTCRLRWPACVRRRRPVIRCNSPLSRMPVAVQSGYRHSRLARPASQPAQFDASFCIYRVPHKQQHQRTRRTKDSSCCPLIRSTH